MSQFSTEFLVSDGLTNAAFAARVLAWLRGMKHARLLDTAMQRELEGDDTRLEGEFEELRLRALGRDLEWQATGCRYDYRERGRIWRTEAVLRRLGPSGNLLRVTAQCLAEDTGARLERPKRPHLIRIFLEDDLACDDGLFRPSLTPHFLLAGEIGLATAEAIIQGTATVRLPVIYLSALDTGGLAFDLKTVAKMAQDLAGVAHVVCEPSREFSFDLRDYVGGGNVYNGTVAIALPGEGFVRRGYVGRSIPDAAALREYVEDSAFALRSAMPTKQGWDWIELQDQLIRHQREAEKKRLSTSETEALWLEEVANKDERIAILEAELKEIRAAYRDQCSEQRDIVFQGACPEIYPGEHVDRIRAALEFCIEKGADAGWDRRSLAVFADLMQVIPPSSALHELRQDLQRATRDPARLNAEMRKLLQRHGYMFKSDNGHSRMAAAAGFVGLDSITLMNTPSDRRGLDNLRSDVEKILGIPKLKQLKA